MPAGILPLLLMDQLQNAPYPLRTSASPTVRHSFEHIPQRLNLPLPRNRESTP